MSRLKLVRLGVVFFFCWSVASDRANAETPSESMDAFPSLEWVLRTARERAPEVVAQRGALLAADATMVGARLSPVANPTVELFADRPLSTTGTAIQGNLWIPIEISGQRRQRIATSETLSAWRGAELAAARARAMGTAVAAYGAVIVNAERLRFLFSVLATSKEEALYYQGRFQHGDATVWEAKLAAVEVARNTVTLQEAQANLTRALAELAALLAMPSLAPPAGPLPPPPDVPWERPTISIKDFAARSPVVAAHRLEATYFDYLRSREAIEAHAPFNLIISGARGDFGERRIGGGLAWTLPALRRNQGERAQARAEQSRALEEGQNEEIRATARLRGLNEERSQVLRALTDLRQQGMPAADAALEAALGVQRAGKGDLLHILAARRDMALLKVAALSLILRQWTMLADLVTLTGDGPRS